MRMILWLLQAVPAPAAPIAPGAPPAPGAPIFDNIFLWTLLLIFLSAIVGAFLRLRTRDKCLRLMHDYHVTYLSTAGLVLWGDLLVFSQGMELRFDAPYTTRRKITKNSALIYQNELATCLAVCRTIGSLTEQEKKDRQAQIKASFNPGLIRRMVRWFNNMMGTLRDAVSKSFSAMVGQFAKANPANAVLTTQRTQVDQIGQTVLGAVAYSYEPMLERHIGTPVVVEIINPTDPARRPIEFPGYLAEYTDKYIAVFNVDHPPVEALELEITAATEGPGWKAEVEERQVRLTCTGPDALLIKSSEAGGVRSDLEVILLPGTTLSLGRPANQPVKLSVVKTQQFDLVCPRTIANVRFGGQPSRARSGWIGLAPEEELGEREAQQEQPHTQISARTLLSALNPIRAGFRALRRPEDEKPGENK